MALSKKKKAIKKIMNPATGNAITLTLEVIDNCERLYRLGMQDSAVANFLNINPLLLREWLIKGAAFNHGLHGELFRRCAKAVAVCEIELMSELRKHAFGAPAEYEYNIKPDGTKEVALDGDGLPIVKRAEIKGNPTWITWLMERRFNKSFGKQAQVGFSEHSVIDSGIYDAALKNENEQAQQEQEIDVSILNEGEQIKILEAALMAKKKRNAED